jgi:putative SOS response-associated peptidase YedK
MCGRYRLSRPQRIVEQFEAEPEEDFQPHYNIAPTQMVPAVRMAGAARMASSLRWGLIPWWANDMSIGAVMINARSESVDTNRAFRDAFRRHRCLIPADGFYEWKKAGKERQPYNFSLKDDSLFAFAGIWDRWKSPAGAKIESCSILTTDANSLVVPVHDRMPVILPRRHYETWLTTPDAQADKLKELLVPFDPKLMKSYPVSRMLNKPDNDGPECAEEISLQETGTLDLWG